MVNSSKKNAGIIGLGLIGGSMAKAIKKKNEYNVYGHDILEGTLQAAQCTGAIDAPLDILIENLQQYKSALNKADCEKLRSLLREGKDTKKQAG